MDRIKVIIFIEELFEDVELVYPYYRMKEEGYDVKLAGPSAGKEYKGKKGMVLKSDLSISDVVPEEVSALIIPGGYAPDKMRKNGLMVSLVKTLFRDCKVLAAVCHGPWMFVEADLLKGRKVTGAKAISTDLENAGGQFVDKPVVVQDNIITSRGPGDLPEFCKAIIIMIREYFKDR